MMDVAERWLLLAAVSFALLCGLMFVPALGQDHHRPQDMDIHERFYSTWMMPDNRSISCCSKHDCEPAEAYQKDGQWFARKESDTGNFTPVPRTKVETERDSPDGRNHLCGRSGSNGGELSAVYCFIAGSGS